MGRRRALFEIYRNVYSRVVRWDELVLDHLRTRGAFDAIGSAYSIGAGWGGLEVELARTGVKVGYCEPFSDFCAELEQRFHSAGLSDSIIDRHCGPFETAAVSSSYDLVLAVQSWYYFAFDPAVLVRAAGLAGEAGHLVIVLSVSDTPLRQELELVPASVDSDRLSAWLAEHGIEHTHETVGWAIQRETLLTGEGSLTDDAIGLVSYMQSRLPEELPAAYLAMVRDAIASNPNGLDRSFGVLTIPTAAILRSDLQPGRSGGE